MINDSLKDQAVDHIKEAYSLLKESGISESLESLLFKESWYQDFLNNKDQEYIELFRCAICPDSHHMVLSIKKDKSFQYSLSIEIEEQYNHLSLFYKLKRLFYFAKDLFLRNRSCSEFLLDKDDLTKFKDILKKIP